jgi:hypothetical protein
MKEYFSFDDRLGIHVPDLDLDWEYYKMDTQQTILFQWEQIRGSIPDRIADLERTINMKQAQLADETDFPRSCHLNREIAELASVINDLWIWYRTNDTSSLSDKILQ